MWFNDYEIAKRYVNKCKDAHERGLEMGLTFAQMKKILSAKKCQLSGMDLDATTITLDRVDASKGYITGNVVACHHAINQMKGVLENPQHEIDIKLFAKVLNKTLKLMEKQ